MKRTGQAAGRAFAASGRIGPVRAVAVTVLAVTVLGVIVPVVVEGAMLSCVLSGALIWLTIAKLSPNGPGGCAT